MKVVRGILFVTLLATSTGAATDPFVGKWVMDPKHSDYPVGASPKTMIIEMEATGRGVHYKSDTVFDNGQTTHAEYTADYDGNQVMVTGANRLMLPVSLKRVDSRTVVASYTKFLRVVATSRRVVSEDGRRMTITTTLKDKYGKEVTTIGVYKRQ